MAGHALLGTWEIIYMNVAFNRDNNIKTNLQYGLGVRFRLDETGDVTWTVAEELKSIPLFSCETYEIYSTSIHNVFIRFGAYAGHVIEFKSDQAEPKENVTLTCEEWGILHCKRVYEESEDWQNAQFSLLPALEDGYFSDITLIATNHKEFKVHSSIIRLLGDDIPWQSEPPPFLGLSEDVLGTILHFLYAECLPSALTEATARQVIKAVSQYASLSKLANMCQIYLKNMALKQQIITLVNEMHDCINQIIEHFTSKGNNSVGDGITSNPAKFCFVVKQSIRDALLAGAKFLLLCDLFTKRKNELSKEERHEIIRYAKSRLPIFLSQLHRFLKVMKTMFTSMSASQRYEVATYLVPEVEVMLDTVSMLIVEVEKALQQIIEVLPAKDNTRSKSSIPELIGKSLRNMLHVRELTKLRRFHEHTTYSVGVLLHKKESFNEMSPPQKVRSVARNLEEMIEELPLFLLRLEDVIAGLDEKLEWREFKFCFKVGTSKVSGVLQKLLAHKDTLQQVMIQICDLVQRDAFVQSLQSLGLLECNTSTTNSSSEHQKVSKSSSLAFPNKSAYRLNLVESLCVPPTANNSTLSNLCLQLLKDDVTTDMQFEVVCGAAECSEMENCNLNKSVEEEKSVMKAHRVILAARCDWFRRALLSGMREAIDRKITIHDTNPPLFQIFLEYLYGGRLDLSTLSTDQLAELLLLSDRYEVDSLKQVCECALQSNIDHDSAIYFLSMADQCNTQMLKNACLNYISQHQELTENEIFYELPIVLQAEVFECFWTQPAEITTEREDRVAPSEGSSSVSEMQNSMDELHLNSEMSSRSFAGDASHEAWIQQLTDLLGDPNVEVTFGYDSWYNNWGEKDKRFFRESSDDE